MPIKKAQTYGSWRATTDDGSEHELEIDEVNTRILIREEGQVIKDETVPTSVADRWDGGILYIGTAYYITHATPDELLFGESLVPGSFRMGNRYHLRFQKVA